MLALQTHFILEEASYSNYMILVI